MNGALMTKTFLLSAVALIAAGSTAFAAPAVRDYRPASVAAPAHKQKIADTQPTTAPAAAFGAAVENALITPGPQSVSDPTGKFVVRVADINGERVVSLVAVATNQSRQWKLAGDAKALGSTITEIMTATGQSSGPGIGRAGDMSAPNTK